MTPNWFDPGPYDDADVHRLDVAGAAITYRKSGASGPTVLFLHGGKAHAAWWAPQVALLRDTRTAWAAMDISGHGDSSWRPNYHPHQWIDEIAAVTRSLGAEGEVHIVGHSLGGMLGVLLAARGDVEAVRSVIAIDAFPPDQREIRQSRLVSNVQTVYATEEEGVANFAERSARAAWPTWLAEFVGRRTLRPVDGGWVWCHDPSTELLERPGLEDLSALQTLDRLALITGDHSPFRDMILASGSLERLGATLARRSMDTGHDVMMERPEQFHVVMREVLDDIIERR